MAGPRPGIAPVGGNNGYGLYFNANDLGAGRRTGMNIFTEGKGGKPGAKRRLLCGDLLNAGGRR